MLSMERNRLRRTGWYANHHPVPFSLEEIATIRDKTIREVEEEKRMGERLGR